MLHIIIIVCIGFILHTNIQAQTFSLIDTDVSNFPRVRVQFLASDINGQVYTNLSVNDFSLRENGRSMQATLSTNCIESNEDPTAHVVLVVDRSRSMLDIVDKQSGETRWDWVKAGVESFLQQFPFTPPSSVALISFAGIAKLESDFRTSAQPIIDAINQIKPDGSTKYDPPLLDSTFGAIYLLSQKPRNIRRIIVFLTDGQPDTPPQADTIIARCKREAITFYAITVGLSMNADLDRIAKATGGKSFAVFTKERLKDIYRLIALEATLRLKCFLEWTAPWSCSEQERFRNVEATFLRSAPPITSSIQYFAPPQSIAAPTPSGQVFYFGNPAPGNSTTHDITITAVNSPLRVTSIPIVPSGFYTVADLGGKSLPFTLQPGESWTFTVRFTQQGSKQYRQATLTVEGNPCPVTVTLVGGLSRALVIAPNGGEIFSTCDSVDIRWTGVESTQAVEVYYTLTGNLPNPSWQLISRNAKGFSLRWKPPQPGQRYRIRVVVPDDSAYLWAMNIGGTSFDTCRSIALDAQQRYGYVAGTFTGTASAGDTTMTSAGETDMFLARFDSDGNIIWVRSGGGNRSDHGCCVTTDLNNNIYVGGHFRSNTIFFGGINQSKSNPNDAVGIYIVRYNANGNAVQASIGGGGSSSTCEGYVDSIAYVSNSIYLYGRFKGRLVFSTSPTISISSQPNAFSPFTAIFDQNLMVQSLQRTYTTAPYTKATVRDTSGNRYETGGFRGQLQSGSYSVSSNGDVDVFIRKFGIIPGSLDVSDTTFQVVSPLIRFRIAALDIGSIAVGDIITQTFSGVLCNDGEIPITISSMSFGGPQGAQFQVVSNYAGYVLKPGECVNVELLFRPSFEGPHTATLTVQGNCGAPAQTTVTGMGLPPCKLTLSTPPTLYTSVGSSRQIQSFCLLRNDGSKSIDGTLRLTNNPGGIFQASIPASNCTVDATMGCPFTLSPGACLTVNITFAPSTAGVQSAQFDIEVPAECGGKRQQPITGVGLAPQVDLIVPAFTQRRVLTSTTLQATLRNTNDSLDAIITSITLRNPANPNFQLSGIPKTPFTLSVKQALNFDVIFTPQSEGTQGETIEVRVQGILDPIAAQTSGIGVLPKIQTEDVVFNPVPVGVTSAENKSLIIRNTSTTAPLVVKSIIMPNNQSFWFPVLPQTPITIPIGESVNIPVQFRPTIPGLNTIGVQIISDAATGPELDPSVTTTVSISGIGLALQVTTPPDFGDILLCETVVTRTITISNPGTQEEIITVTVSGDSESFAVEPLSLTLPPGATDTIYIRYTPSPGQRSIRLTLNSTAFSEPYTLTYTANGVTQPFFITVSSVNVDVGTIRPVALRLQTDPAAGSLVRTLEIYLQYSTTALDIDQSKFQTQQNNWNWSLQKMADGALLTGSSAIGILTGVLTVEVPMTAYTSLQLRHLVTPTFLNGHDYPCLVPTLQPGQITIPYYCAQEVRQVTITSPSSITVRQDEGSNIVINVTIGSDMPYTIELFSILGERTLRITEGIQKGTYIYLIPSNTLSGGIYFVRFSTPLGTITNPLLISR